MFLSINANTQPPLQHYLSISSICSVVFPSSVNDRSSCGCCCCWRLLVAISSICWCRSAFCFPNSSQRRLLLDRSSWRSIKLLAHFGIFERQQRLDKSYTKLCERTQWWLVCFPTPVGLVVLPSAVSPLRSRLQFSPVGGKWSCSVAPLTPSSVPLLAGIFSSAPAGPPHQPRGALAPART